ncbi:MAG: hypothetical protein IT531_15390 [Burkholderiales bacterium]|nr:hypothetical protein [Burkholderiales bacterium]
MESDIHRNKAERIERSLDRCQPSDFETVIEGALLSAGHWFNLALHDMGFYPPGRDVLHLTKLPLEDFLRVEAIAPDLLQAYAEMEELRSPYVRGAEANGQAAAARALELLAEIRAKACSVRSHRMQLPATWDGGPGKK